MKLILGYKYKFIIFLYILNFKFHLLSKKLNRGVQIKSKNLTESKLNINWTNSKLDRSELKLNLIKLGSKLVRSESIHQLVDFKNYKQF